MPMMSYGMKKVSCGTVSVAKFYFCKKERNCMCISSLMIINAREESRRMRSQYQNRCILPRIRAGERVLYELARTAIHKSYGIGGLNNRDLFSHSSASPKSGVGRSSFLQGLWPWLAHGRLLAVSSHGLCVSACPTSFLQGHHLDW